MDESKPDNILAPPTKEEFEGISNMIQARLMNYRETRRGVVAKASRMIDALIGQGLGVGKDGKTITGEFSPAPAGIPELGWESVLPSAGPEDTDFRMHIVGDLGGYYTDIFSNERPADTFNAGFYAGVLAMKAGLIDPELFHADNEDKRRVVADENAQEADEDVLEADEVTGPAPKQLPQED